MAITVRNIDGTYLNGWNDAGDNAFSARFLYETGDLSSDVLKAMDEWLSGFPISSAAGTAIGATLPAWLVTLIDANKTYFKANLWDASTGTVVEEVSISAITAAGITTGASITGTYSDTTHDKISFAAAAAHPTLAEDYNIYGESGWRTIGSSGTPITIRTYKALNDGGTATSTGTHWKYMSLDLVASAPDFLLKTASSITGVTLTDDTGSLVKQPQVFNNAAGDAVDGPGEFWVSASEQHFFFISYYGTNTVGDALYGGCSGIAEFRMDHPLMTFGEFYTPWYLFQAYINQGTTLGFNYIQTPRTVFNTTNKGNGIITNFCQYAFTGASASSSIIGVSADPLGGRNRVSDITMVQNSSFSSVQSTVVGVSRKIKLLFGGTFLDEVSIDIDADGYLDNNGVSSDFIVMPGIQGDVSFGVPK